MANCLRDRRERACLRVYLISGGFPGSRPLWSAWRHAPPPALPPPPSLPLPPPCESAGLFRRRSLWPARRRRQLFLTSSNSDSSWNLQNASASQDVSVFIFQHYYWRLISSHRINFWAVIRELITYVTRENQRSSNFFAYSRQIDHREPPRTVMWGEVMWSRGDCSS
jgi:hypothetical protein